jgi:hypothetical protein
MPIVTRAYAKVKPDWDHWGIIDQRGDYVIPPEFRSIHEWSEGLIRLERRSSDVNWNPYKQLLNGQYAFANRDGQIISDYWGYANDFHEGRAAVAANRKWGFIDSNGEIVIGFDFHDARDFHEGMCAVEQNGKWGYIGLQGQWLLPNRFSFAMDFQFGLAIVENDATRMVIDREGNKIVEFPQEYGWGEIKSETLLLYGTSSGYPGERFYGFMSTNGVIGTAPIFYTNSDSGFNTSELSDGMLGVFNRQGEYGFVNAGGELVIPCQFEWASNFKDGKSRARKDGKEFYIDKGGNILAGAREERVYPFDEVLSFHEGLAAARKGDIWGIIDEVGNVVIDFRFKRRLISMVGDEGLYFSDYYPKFSAGLLSVKHEYDGDRWCGYLDRAGEIAIPFNFKVGENFEIID